MNEADEQDVVRIDFAFRRELARKVYRGFDDRVRSARIWGHGVADGQNVHLDHVLHDRDIVELHA